ncbi:MAG TPA: hypothetical protein VK796_07445, partial [Cytophaga sp.]|nr:hypothetical protein [Cytophaga sp.]
MLPKFLYLTFLTLLFSCNQQSSENGAHQDGLKQTSIDTINTQHSSVAIKKDPNENVYVHEIGNHYEYDNDVRSLGLGLILTPEIIEIFDDSLLKEKFIMIDQLHAKKDREVSVYSKFYMPEYTIMHFVCLHETLTSYEVLVNYSDIKYLPKTKGYIFKTWRDYILNSYGVRRKTKKGDELAENFSLLKQANDHADTLAIPKGLEMFCPMDMKDDWIKVTYDCFYNFDDA